MWKPWQILATAAALVLTAGLTVWLASSRGLTGVGWAWLITNALIALVALPKLRSVLFRGSLGFSRGRCRRICRGFS